MEGFATRFVTGRWFMAVGSFLIMMGAGSGYLYSVYSPELKTSLGYDQTTLNLLGFITGISIGLPAGILMEFAPAWFVLLVGCVLNFIGYFMTWLAVSKRIPKPPFWRMTLYMWIAVNARCFTTTAVMVQCVKNFPKSRGELMGLLKGFLGLGAGFYTQLYLGIYGTNAKDAILLASWFPVFVVLVFLRTIRYIKHVEHEQESDVFYQFLYVSFGIAGFLLVMTILQQEFIFTRAEYILSATGAVLTFSSLFIVAYREESKCWKKDLNYTYPDHNNPIIITQPPSQSEQPATSESSSVGDSCFQNVFRPPNLGEDYTVLQAIFSIDMIALLASSICGLAGAGTAIDNFGQIGESLGYSKHSVRTCVSLISIWNYLGRVGSGFGSEHLFKKYKFPRPLMLTIAQLFSCLGHILIASGVKHGLYVSSGVLGLCFGAQWPLIYAIISELFGLKHFSTLLNIGTIASPLGGYLLNVRLTGQLYDKEAKRQLQIAGRVRKAGEELVCSGPKCFRAAFITITWVTAFGMLCSVILVMRTKTFYQGDIYKKFRDDDGGKGTEMR